MQRQPEFPKHVSYTLEMQEKGPTVLSEPLKQAGGLGGVLSDGGMTIYRAPDLEEARRIAGNDPTIKSGILNVEVKMLWVPFHE